MFEQNVPNAQWNEQSFMENRPPLAIFYYKNYY